MKVFGIGTFGKDPEVKSLSSGTSLCSFSLAATRKFKDKDGNKVTDWINCVSWGKTADVIAQYFRKGSKIMIEGELQTRSYDDKDGKRVTVTEINITDFEFVESKKEQGQTYAPPAPSVDNGFYPAMDDDTTLPFDL